MGRILTSFLFAGAWLLLLPEAALAWGPATHVALGEAVLRAGALLPPAVRAALERFPTQFLYGSVAADISFAKKYAPVGRHCHHWHVGEEILASADSEEMAAVGYGYLAHLAADTIAHNFYVPRRLLLTSTTQAVGHTYWEARMDVHLGDDYAARARRLVVEYDHSEADELFDTVLSRTLFSFQTNRRIFRGMILVQDNDQWRQVFDRLLRFSRFDLPDPLMERYFSLSLDYVLDFLARREESRASSLDPIGEVNLRLAKKVRRRGLAKGGATDPALLDDFAEEFFPLPGGPLLYVPRAPELVLPSGLSPGPGADRWTRRSEPER